MSSLRVNPGTPGERPPFVVMDVGDLWDYTMVHLHSLTPEQLEDAAAELRQAQEVHRLAATQAALMGLEKGA